MAKKKITEKAIIEDIETPEDTKNGIGINELSKDEVDTLMKAVEEEPKKTRSKKPEKVEVEFIKNWYSPKGIYKAGNTYTIKYADYKVLLKSGSVKEV